jgi:hypothetical protein
MDAQAFLNILKNSGSEESSDNSEYELENEESDSVDEQLEQLLGDHKKDFKKNPDREKVISNKLFTNKDMEQFINHVGFDVDEVPNFTSIARKLMPQLQEPSVEKNLTKLDNHDIIKDISPARKNAEPDIKKEALKRLIAKYRG